MPPTPNCDYRSAKVIAVGKPTDIEAGKRAMASAGEVTFNNSTTTGLGEKAASNIQWEPVEFSELKDVLRFAKQMAGSLDRLDLVRHLLLFFFPSYVFGFKG
jgi:hypothetical protein